MKTLKTLKTLMKSFKKNLLQRDMTFKEYTTFKDANIKRMMSLIWYDPTGSWHSFLFSKLILTIGAFPAVLVIIYKIRKFEKKYPEYFL